MITLKRTFKVKVILPNEEGEFYCTFKRRKQNEALNLAREAKKLEALRASDDPDVAIDALESMLKLLGGNLVSIEGLCDEDGTPITAEQFLKNDLYEDVILAVLKAHTDAASGGAGSEEKKE
jgi:hypothetical protein